MSTIVRIQEDTLSLKQEQYLGEFDHDEGVEAEHVLLVGLVLLLSSIVDIRKENAILHIIARSKGIVPVLGLHLMAITEQKPESISLVCLFVCLMVSLCSLCSPFITTLHQL